MEDTFASSLGSGMGASRCVWNCWAAKNSSATSSCPSSPPFLNFFCTTSLRAEGGSDTPQITNPPRSGQRYLSFCYWALFFLWFCWISGVSRICWISWCCLNWILYLLDQFYLVPQRCSLVMYRTFKHVLEANTHMRKCHLSYRRVFSFIRISLVALPPLPFTLSCTICHNVLNVFCPSWYLCEV